MDKGTYDWLTRIELKLDYLIEKLGQPEKKEEKVGEKKAVVRAEA